MDKRLDCTGICFYSIAKIGFRASINKVIIEVQELSSNSEEKTDDITAIA